MANPPQTRTPSQFAETVTPGMLRRRTFLGGLTASGLLVVGSGTLASCSQDGQSESEGASETKRRKGGTLTVGITGGTPADQLDPNSGGLNNPQVARINMLFNALVVLDVNAQVQYDLAEEITPNKDATEWTIKLRKGVTFHDGKPFTADDVVYTFNRVLDPKKPLQAKASLGPIDVKNIAKVDDHTVRLPYLFPYATLVEQMATYFYFLYIAPTGFDVTNPIGTGPFKYESFTPTRQSTFVKNENYWRDGLPYLDRVVITDFSDGSAAANALASGQLNAYAGITPTDTLTFKANSSFKILQSRSGSFSPFTMRVDKEPFTDKRVRQAMRLIVNRPKLISNALGGEATPGSDVFSPFDPCFDKSLDRQQDIEQAKSLLRSAGKEDLAIELTTTAAHQFNDMAQLFAQDADSAGVKVKLNRLDTASYYGPEYHNYLFAFQYWLYNPYLPQVAQSQLPGVPGSSTHFDNAEYNKLYAQANATVEESARCDISQQMMKIDFEEGGYIIPAFLNVNDAYQSTIKGFRESRIGLSLGNYGFDEVSLE